MGTMNRQMRRQQQRQEMRNWVRDGTAERVRKLSQNGITQQDLNEYHKKGYEEGYLFASSAFMKKMYASIAKELIDDGNDKEVIFQFIHRVDQRFAVMFDADEEVEDVFNQIGVRMNLEPDGINTIERC